MHEELLKSHRLAHYGRLQFALFLKGMGLDVKDSIKFFKGEYSKSGDKKLNEYIYYIEHMYGIKGSRKDYAPYGCDKITKFNASTEFILFKAEMKFMDVHSLTIARVN